MSEDLTTPFQVLIAWLHVTVLEDAEPMQVRPLVSAALHSLLEDDPRFSDLKACEDQLWEGVVPVEALRQLVEDWQEYEPLQDTPEGVLLEQEFRRLAQELPTKDWVTDAYRGALEAVNAYEDGQDDAIEQWTLTMTGRLEAAWSSYSSATLTEAEITAETVVGHRLLKEGIQGWYDAQEMLVEAVDQGLDFDDGLACAEEASRLLVVVQRLASRVKHAAG